MTQRRARSRRWWLRSRARVRAVRARVRRTPAGRLGWRIGVGLVGGVLLVAGVVMIPGPGQGWATVLLALAVLSTEFSWARRARQRLWDWLVTSRAAWDGASRGTRVLAGTGLALVVVVALVGASWGSLALTGLPGWVPTPAASLLTQVPGVD